MLKFMTAAVVAAVLVFATQATSEAAGRGRCTTAAPVYATYPVAAPQVAAAPGGYRSFSYEPAAPTYRSSSMRRSYSTQPSYLNAGSKALGRFGE